MSIIMDATNGITTANLTANTSISTPSIGSSTLTTPTISGLMTLNGGQIKFPATQVPSADANTLDDYEEGTFTPIIISDGWTQGTYAYQYGKYTKIGRLVNVQIHIKLTGKGTLGGGLYLGGFPFGMPEANNLATMVHIGGLYLNSTINNLVGVFWLGSDLIPIRTSNGTGGEGYVSVNDITVNSEFRTSFFYYTT